VEILFPSAKVIMLLWWYICAK